MRSAAIGAVILLAACGGEKAPEHSKPKAGAAATSATAQPSHAPTQAAAAVPSPEEPYAPAASPAERNMRFQALGNEPFWSVTVGGKMAIYTTPEDQRGTPVQYGFSFKTDALRYEWKQDGRAFDLVIAKGTCNDGMSDRVYEWKATLTIDGKVEQGCAVQK